MPRTICIKPPLTFESKETWKMALERCAKHGRNIECVDVLLAFVARPNLDASQVLSQYGIDAKSRHRHRQQGRAFEGRILGVPGTFCKQAYHYTHGAEMGILKARHGQMHQQGRPRAPSENQALQSPPRNPAQRGRSGA